MHASKAFELYNQNKDLFQFAYKWNNTLFTHAGVNTNWLAENKIPENVDKLIDLLNFQKIFTEIHGTIVDNSRSFYAILILFFFFLRSCIYYERTP